MHGYLATAARVKYPAALQRCKFDTPLLAAGSLICSIKMEGSEKSGESLLDEKQYEFIW
ncbi:hypothetical protein HMPREF1548_04743 [Clostridium sp. KLE 1755]|nr:hypothetical protein HMPREF1548_04743 [Clostridium sp. KLE 1755]